MRNIRFKAKKIEDAKLFNAEGVFYNPTNHKWSVVVKNNFNKHIKEYKCLCQCLTEQEAQKKYIEYVDKSKR